MTRRSGELPALAAVLLLAAAALGSVAFFRAPEPLPAEAPETEASAGRAMEWVRILSAEARPLGSTAHREAQDRIVAALGEAGFETEIHTASVTRARRSSAVGARVVNVVARRRGTGSGDAVLFLAHYDSRSNTFGAADDASGVAAILEAVRALRGERFRNDLLVVISDAEEIGLLGAEAFAAEHPWLEDVRVVLNFEARGQRGPVTMFETAEGSGPLVKLFARSSPYPAADSFTYEVYRRMPNDTDYTVFRRRGIRGLNFAYLDGFAAYHTDLDTAERLSPRSLQHLVSTAVTVGRALADADLGAIEGPDLVYFNPWGTRWLLTYPASWVPFFAGLLVAAVVGLLGLAVRRQRLTVGEILVSFAGVIGSLLIGTMVAVGGWRLLSSALSATSAAPHGTPWWPRLWGVGIFLVVLAGLAATARTLGRAGDSRGPVPGVLLLLSSLSAAAALFAPSGSHVFQWPLLLALPPAAWLLLRGEREGFPWLSFLVALPAAVLLAPFVDLLHVAMTFRSVAPTAVFAGVALLPALPLLSRLGTRLGTVVPALVGVLACAFLVLASPLDSEHPASDSLFYLLDADAGTAHFWSLDQESDPWTAGALGESPEPVALPGYLGRGRVALRADAEPLPLLAPEVEALAVRELGEGRRLRLRVISHRRAQVLRLSFEGDSRMRVQRVDGREVEGDWGGPEECEVVFFGADDEGLEIEVELARAELLVVHVVDESWGLPDGSLPPRPPDRIPDSGWWTDATFVHRSASF